MDSLGNAIEQLPVGWRGHYFREVDSTQRLAREAARSGAPDRSVFVAEFQRAGRGRHGRSWLAASGSAVLLSFVFRATSAPRPWHFTRLCSLALAQAIEHEIPHLRAAIKWPNDVMLGDRKVAGILAETLSDGQQLVAIVGVGINVSARPADIETATCLREWTHAPLDRGALLLGILRTLDGLRDLPDDELHQRWEARLWRRGQIVLLLDSGQQEDVVIVGAAPDGSLRVRTRNGAERYTTTGELLA